MVSEYEIKKQICDIGKRIYDRGMVAAMTAISLLKFLTMNFSAHQQV